jgi:hypothetical protein
MSEQDLALLETLLDGELGLEAADALRRRIATDTELSRSLERIRADREVRQRVWQAMEPQEAQVALLVARVGKQLRREALWSERRRTLRYVSGLAACIMFGFLVGRFIPYSPQSPRDNGIVFEPGRGPVQEVMDVAPESSRPHGFKVQLTDDRGRVIAEQRFETFSEAREFTDDLSRAQERMWPTRPTATPNDTILIKGEF